MAKIKFGTDGWRGVISDDFTFENVRIVAQAMADYLKQKPTPGVVIGYDNRFLADQYARIMGNVLASNGISVILSKDSVPTPALSYAVVNKQLTGGIMITASHNPPEFCGIKFKEPCGGSASEEVTREIEQNLYKTAPLTDSPKSASREEDLISPYLEKLKSMADLDLLKNAGLRIIADPMYGVGDEILAKILQDTNCEVITIHNRKDPSFGGLHPEPIEPYLEELKKEVKKNKAALGVATDGDADRIGVVDEEGTYLPPHHVFPLLLLYFLREKKWQGKVVQTISLGYLSQRIAQKYSLPSEEVPVGFKYVVKIMLKEKVMLGGEESGGYGYQGYIPERDGQLSSLWFFEMLAKTKKNLSQLRKEMEKEFGKSCFKRIDYRIEGLKISSKKEFAEGLARKAPKELVGLPVKEVKTYDGIEYVLQDDSWLLLRPSGTEPILRTYAESASPQRTEELLKKAKELI